MSSSGRDVGEFVLTQAIWREKDFEGMGWHDTTLWAIGAIPDAFEFIVDLDYIVSWVCPVPPEKKIHFWVAPATMVFQSVSDVVVDIKSRQGTIEVNSLRREDPVLTPNGKYVKHTYIFECQEGTISLAATGFEMSIRRTPAFGTQQRLNFDQRGGISFDRIRAPPVGHQVPSLDWCATEIQAIPGR